MALDYAQTADLMKDDAFMDRAKVACMRYATYISGEADNTPAHNTRQRWVRAVFENPDGELQKIMPALVIDDKVQTAGAAIVDNELQIAVETTVNSLF